MSERWQDVPGYEGTYQASTLGRIRSLDRMVKTYKGNTKFERTVAGQILSPFLAHRGYLCITLQKESKRHVKELHTVIAATFLGPRPARYHTHHMNGNKQDNRPVNLTYVPEVEHTRTHNQGEGCHKARLTDEQVVNVRNLLAMGKYQREIAVMYGVSRSTIGEIARGASWKHI